MAIPSAARQGGQNSAYRPALPFILLSILFCFLFSTPAVASHEDSSCGTVGSIRIVGNSHTRKHIILGALRIKPGDCVLRTEIQNAQIRLERLGIFRTTDVVLQPTPVGNVVLVIVEEGLNLLPILTPHRFERKHGVEETWYSLSMQLDFTNFRGRHELFSIGGEVWERKGFSLLWKQPYDPLISPGYLWFQFRTALWPHPYELYDARETFGEAGAGRFIYGPWSAFGRLSYHDLRTDADTLGWPKAFQFPRVGMGFAVDNRNDSYHPTQGLQLSTGVDYFGLPNSEVHFPQANLSCKFYGLLPGFGHYGAMCVDAIRRFEEPPYFRKLYGGGNGTVRGYSSGELRGDNSVILSGEYRCPVWTTPRISFPYVDLFVPAMNRLYSLVEAAVFADAGLYWDFGENPMEKRLASSAGIGLRGWVPPLQRSAIIDFAWNRDAEFYVHAYLDIGF